MDKSKYDTSHTLKPEAYKYDFDGAWAPHNNGGHVSSSFTLGIFQWVPKKGFSGKFVGFTPDQLKRGPVVERIQGWSGMAHEAYNKARKRVAELNAAQQPQS